MEYQDSEDHIKRVFRIFPGAVLGVKRRVGKTTALLQLIHEQYSGMATLYSPTQRQSERAGERYREMYPEDQLPRFIVDAKEARGYDNPILVDEWWFVRKPEQRELMGTRRVIARIGTEV